MNNNNVGELINKLDEANYDLETDEISVVVDGREIKVAFKDAIRQLNDEEKAIYSSAITFAVSMILPSFRDALSVLRPFYDETAETAYSDEYARVGLGPWFFSDKLSTKQRASVLLHESMHILNDHFVRGKNYGSGFSPVTLNIAGDFEINCALETMPTVDLDFAVFPDKEPFSYKRNLMMEEYLSLMKKDGKDTCKECGSVSDHDTTNDSQSSNDQSGGSSSSGEEGTEGQSGGSSSSGEEGTEGQSNDSSNSGNSNKCSTCGKSNSSSDSFKSRGETGRGCGVSNEHREKAADEAGVERASDAERSISKRNTRVRINEELKKSKQAGYGHMDNFFQIMSDILAPAKVDWRIIFRQIVSSSLDIAQRGRQDYSYKRVNRRFANSKYIFPGMVEYNPKIMLGIDTSWSMSKKDYESTLSEIEYIIKNIARGRSALKLFTVDTKIADIQTVSSIKDINLIGGGGTRMATAFEYINTLPKSEFPDVFVLSTDAELFGNDWKDIEDAIRNAPRRYTPVILVTDESTLNSVPETLKTVSKVIDIS